MVDTEAIEINRVKHNIQYGDTEAIEINSVKHNIQHG